MWAVGVMAYEMLCGYLPFQAKNIPRLYMVIMSATYEFQVLSSFGSRFLFILSNFLFRKMTGLEFQAMPKTLFKSC